MLGGRPEALQEASGELVWKQPPAAGKIPATEEFLELGRDRAWGPDGHGWSWAVIRALAGTGVSRECGLLLRATDKTQVRTRSDISPGVVEADRRARPALGYRGRGSRLTLSLY